MRNSVCGHISRLDSQSNHTLDTFIVSVVHRDSGCLATRDSDFTSDCVDGRLCRIGIRRKVL